MNKTFNGSFTTIGKEVSKHILGLFEYTESEKVNITLNNSNIPIATIGFIKNNDLPIPNARVTFIKDYTVNDKSNLKYSGNKVIWDWDITDTDGKYVVFLEPGIYTVRIDCGKYSNYYTGEVIEHGLDNEYYYTIDGLIKNRWEDTLAIHGTDKKIIKGIMIDEYNKPVINAEIIISQKEEVKTFIKTDENGLYMFGLENGIYDIRIRAKNQSVNIIRNFSFEDGRGFFTTNPHTIETL